MNYYCKITGHLCGTDTWLIGCSCICSSCTNWLVENQVELDIESETILRKNLWDLYR